MSRCTQYNIMCHSLSVACGRSVVFSVYSDILHQWNLQLRYNCFLFFFKVALNTTTPNLLTRILTIVQSVHEGIIPHLKHIPPKIRKKNTFLYMSIYFMDSDEWYHFLIICWYLNLCKYLIANKKKSQVATTFYVYRIWEKYVIYVKFYMKGDTFASLKREITPR